MDKKIIESLWNLPIKELESLIPNIKPLIALNFKPSKKNLIREIEKKGIAFYIKKVKYRSQFVNFFNRDELSAHYGNFKELSDQEFYRKIEKLGIQKHSEFFNFPLEEKKEKSKSQEIVTLEKPLYPYQNRVKKQIIEFLFSKKKQTLVQMPTGSGKTRATMEAICDYLRYQSIDNKTNIVWFAYNSELCEQAIESFQENWKKYGNQEMDIIRVWGTHNKNDIKINKNSFIVVSLDTAFNLIKTKNDQIFELMNEIKENCSILICDEAHQSIAETYKAALQIFQNYNTKLIGLTATPGRRIDEEIQELINFYNGELISLVDEKGNKYDKPLKTLTDDG